ncbi:unnamed protein product [Effrenium voratum]|nr:unnamed protein product [Effrenium voratum]
MPPTVAQPERPAELHERVREAAGATRKTWVNSRAAVKSRLVDLFFIDLYLGAAGELDPDSADEKELTYDLQSKFDAVRCYKQHLDGVRNDRELETMFQAGGCFR